MEKTGNQPPPGGPHSPRRQLAAIVFTDIEGSVNLKKSLGDERYQREVLSPHDAIAHRVLAQRGTFWERAGDSFLVMCASPAEAVGATLEFQDAIAAQAWPAPVAVRVGVHVGESLLIEHGTGGRAHVSGLAVDVAARIMSLARGGQILMSRTAADSARQYLRELHDEQGAASELRWTSHDLFMFKGEDSALEVIEVARAANIVIHPPADSDKAWRAPHSDPAAAQAFSLNWLPAVDKPVPGRQSWKLTRRLGGGAFGDVWLGEHATTGEKRVFKFCINHARVRGLRREAKLLTLLKQRLGTRDDIVRLLDWSLDGDPVFLEMPWCELGDFASWLLTQGGAAAVPLGQRLTLLAQVAHGLDAAHAADVCHKDVKPQNILLTKGRDGVVRAQLADFGVGLLTDDPEETAALRSGQTPLQSPKATPSAFTALGTPMYVAPELFEGKPVSRRADIFSLGVVIYQVVAGDLGRALASGWERDIPEGPLRALIAACVDREPSRRPGSAGDVARRLLALVPNGPPTVPASTRRPSRPIAILLVVAIIAVSAVVVWISRSGRENAATPRLTVPSMEPTGAKVPKSAVAPPPPSAPSPLIQTLAAKLPRQLKVEPLSGGRFAVRGVVAGPGELRALRARIEATDPSASIEAIGDPAAIAAVERLVRGAVTGLGLERVDVGTRWLRPDGAVTSVVVRYRRDTKAANVVTRDQVVTLVRGYFVNPDLVSVQEDP